MKQEDLALHLKGGKLKILENLRFEKGEEEGDMDYAQKLADLGEVFVNEAFAAHHIAASTTILPTLLPHAVGLRFFEEVKMLGKVRDNPGRPLVVIIGGVKVEDKLPAVKVLSKIAGEIFQEDLATNILVGKLTPTGDDITEETIESWRILINEARMIVWNGPIGKINDLRLTINDLKSGKGTYQLAKLVAESGAESIVGGGDTVGFVDEVGLLDKFNFVSTGGGAMLKFLMSGTLPTIEALQ
jgi:phosphoglycerate kinase